MENLIMYIAKKHTADYSSQFPRLLLVIIDIFQAQLFWVHFPLISAE